MPLRDRAALQLPMYPATQPSSSRVQRRPQHVFQVSSQPFCITPMMIAPVLPGETMHNLLMQSRIVTDPINNGLVGWWMEYYFFYLRHRDLGPTASAAMQAIMLDPTTNAVAQGMSAIPTSDYTTYYDYEGGLDFIGLCYDAVVKEYFRTVDEVADGTWDDYTIDGYHVASVNRNSWMDSLLPTSALPETDDIFDDADNTTLGELSRQQTIYDAMRDARLTDMDYDDWLATYGVQLPKAEQPGKPELVRYVRDWQYPTNTVEPTTGVPASAVSWAIAERADKKRLFKEPGFLFGCSIARPKVYFGNQRGGAVGMLDNAFAWLPALLQDRPEISLRKFADAETGPLGDEVNTAYWADVRDLYLYGDQYINFAGNTASKNLVALPNAAVTNKRYPSSTDTDGFFKTSGTNKVRQDGVVHLGIAGRQKDMT